MNNKNNIDYQLFITIFCDELNLDAWDDSIRKYFENLFTSDARDAIKYNLMTRDEIVKLNKAFKNTFDRYYESTGVKING